MSSVCSHGQLVLYWLALLHANVVIVEEVHIQHCLKSAAQELGPAEKIFHLVSVNPANQKKQIIADNWTYQLRM